MRRSFFLCCFFALFLAASNLFAGAPAPRVVQEWPAAAETAYSLSFDAKEAGQWIVHTRDAQGRLLYDGALKGAWQKPGAGAHIFRTPAGTAKVQLLLDKPEASAGTPRLEPLPDLLLNGDFRAGPKNYSGWSELYNARLEDRGNGTHLFIDQNGYALTDPVPVRAGGRYSVSSKQGPAGFRILAYDAAYSFIDDIARARSNSFVIPDNVRYIRLLYSTSFDHLSGMRVNEVEQVSLTSQENAALPALPPEDPGWELVLSPGCDSREENAARELRHWMHAITGKIPPLLAEASATPSKKIFVGRAWAGAFDADLKALDESDGYAVRSRNGNIYVFGARPRGTLYGVYALLERNTDIIWPRPNPEFSAFFSPQPSLRFEHADFLSRPVFDVRNTSTSGYRSENVHLVRMWEARNGVNPPQFLHNGNNYLLWLYGALSGYGGGYLGGWIPPETREKDDKILPLIEGKRDSSIWRQPCFTHPGVVKAITETFRRRLKSLPGRELEYMQPRIADNWAVCGCEACMAPIALPNGGKPLTASIADSTKDSLFFSTRHFLMLNKVAEELARDYPKLRIFTHAYIFTAEPPATPIHPAIISEFAAYPTQNARYPILAAEGNNVVSGYDNNIWKRRFEQWGKIKRGALGFFGYYNTPGYNALADTVAEDFRALADYHAVEAHTEGFALDGDKPSIWDADMIEKWVIARLMWDPRQDPQALRAEFIRRVYPGAEREMTEFHTLIRDSWHSAPKSVFVNCHSTASFIFEEMIVKPGIEQKAKQLLLAAEKAARNPLSRTMIGRQIAYFDQLSASVGRQGVPFVPEATHEWMEMSTPHWEKASNISDFKKVDDWRLFKRAASEHPTRVATMHDGKYLYMRITGSDKGQGKRIVPAVPAGEVYPKGDRFEIFLQSSPQKEVYFAVGSGGHYYSFPSFGNQWKTAVYSDANSWTALIAIPLADFGAGEPIKMRVGRVYRGDADDSEESSHNGSSIFNSHDSLWIQLRFNPA